jgi:hypothetical protein
MQLRLVILGLSCSSLSLLVAESAPKPASQQIPLVLPAGVPVRLYLTKRVPKREGATVEAKVLDPMYAFDREVIPAGTVVLGRVIGVKLVSKSERVRAVMGGISHRCTRLPSNSTHW